MRKASLFLILFFCMGLTLISCKRTKDISEMSDEEKIELQMDLSLSESEQTAQRTTRQAIVERINQTHQSDEAIQKALINAREMLSSRDYALLEAAQEQWNRKGKGSDIQALIQRGNPAPEAFSLAMQKRAEWIEKRTARALLLESPGVFGGLYNAEDGRILELYEMPGSTLNLVLEDPGIPMIFTATGNFEEGIAKLHSELDEAIILKVIRVSPGEVKLVTSEEFSQLEGTFKRRKPGEIDVFAP